MYVTELESMIPDIAQRYTNIHEESLALALEVSNINISNYNCDINNNQTNDYESIDELSDDTMSDDLDSCGIHDFKSADTNVDSIKPEIHKIHRANNFKNLSKNKMVTPILCKRKWEVITVDTSIHLFIEPYSKLMFSLQEHHVEEDSQRACHLIEMLKCIVADALQDHADQRLHFAATTLKALKKKEKLGNKNIGWLTFPVFFEDLFKKKSNYYDLDVITVVTVISAVFLYKPTPFCGLGKFERNRFECHKDNIVAIAKTTYKFNRILSLAHDPSEDEVNQVQLHIGLVNAMTIHL
ncbi:31219_t:CDS:2, partial [Racocetra persica]